MKEIKKALRQESPQTKKYTLNNKDCHTTSQGDKFALKKSASLTEIAKQFCLEHKSQGWQKNDVIVNLFRRVLRGEFEFYYTDRISWEHPNNLFLKKTNTSVKINQIELNWLDHYFTRYLDCTNGISAALREVCIRHCVNNEDIKIDYESLLDQELGIKDNTDNESIPGTISKLHGLTILKRYLNKTPDDLTTSCIINYDKKPPRYKTTFTKILRVIDTDNIIWKKISTAIEHPDSFVFFTGKIKKIENIIKDFRRCYRRERERLLINLADRIFIDREDFLHWLKLGRHEKIDHRAALLPADQQPWNFKLLKVNFWGDTTQTQPKCWDQSINDSKGLTLLGAIEQYTDSQLWISLNKGIFEFCAEDKSFQANSASGSLPDYVTQIINKPFLSRKPKKIQAQITKIWNRIIVNFIENIEQNCLKVEAFTNKNDKRKKTKITPAEIQAMFDSNLFDFTSSTAELPGIKYEGIRIYRVNKDLTSIDLSKESYGESKEAARKKAVKRLAFELVSECAKQGRFPLQKKRFSELLLEYGITNNIWQEGEYQAATIYRDLSRLWSHELSPALKAAKSQNKKL